MIQAGIIGTLNGLEKTFDSICTLPEYIMTGFYANDPDTYRIAENRYRIRKFHKADDLIDRSDIIIISDQAGEFNELICKVIRNSKHILIFSDISLSISQLAEYVKLAEEAGVFMFFYHEGYNRKWHDIIINHVGRPEYIDDYICPVPSEPEESINIFETFYRELFIVMKIFQVNPRKFFTTAIPYYSSDPEFLNARVEFVNGTAANITVDMHKEDNKSRLDVLRHDHKATINHSTGEIKVFTKNEQVFHFRGNTRNDYRRDGLKTFRDYLLSGNYTSDPFETGITAHKTAIEIIHQLVPFPEKILIHCF